MKAIRNFLAGLVAYAASVGSVLMANLYSQRTYDNSLLLKASAAVAATADGTIILDTGGTGLLQFDLVLDVSAITQTADNKFRILVEGSPDATLGTAANIVTLCELTLGGTTGAAPMGAADNIGRFLVCGRNERNGVTYRYLRIRTEVAGTAPSITYMAWLAKSSVYTTAG